MIRPSTPPLNAVIGGTIIALLVAVIAVSLVWTPFDPLAVDIRARLKPPDAVHWLGTDEFGRDILSRAMVGARTSAAIALATVLFATSGGTLVGVLSGFTGGWADRVLMALNNTLLAFPGVLLALALMVVLGAGERGVVLALGLAYLPSVARVVRGAVLSLRETAFVEASFVIGNGAMFTMARHVVPNLVAPLTVLATSMFGWVLLSESALSFLGLGVPPPAPTWGNMLAGSRPHIQSAVWLGLVPGACITLTMLGINLLGDALRDRFDPRMAAA